MDSVNDHPDGWGFPIRKSSDQSVLATPRSLSQPATSFIASQCQGIRQTPFLRLISRFVSETTILRSSSRLVPCRGRPPPRKRPLPIPATLSRRTERGISRLQTSSDKRCQRTISFSMRWWRQTGSNRRPPACKAGALPTELCPRLSFRSARLRFVGRRDRPLPEGRADRAKVVGQGGFEPPTSRLSSARSNQLSY
jgi:hypothetical protein